MDPKNNLLSFCELKSNFHSETHDIFTTEEGLQIVYFVFGACITLLKEILGLFFQST